MDGTEPRYMQVIDHGGQLPELTRKRINLYAADTLNGEAGGAHLLALIRQGYRDM